MSKTCSQCTYMDPCRRKDNLYWCERKLEWVSPCAVACYRFCEAYKRSESEAKSLRENSSSYSSGCFITTIVCDILGKDDKCLELMTLRRFRDDILQKDIQYKEVLAMYDIVGPKIATNIKLEKRTKMICKNLYRLGIKKICKLVSSRKYKEAVEAYIEMTELLMQAYGIQNIYDQDYLDNMDMSKSGHGRKEIKKVLFSE